MSSPLLHRLAEGERSLVTFSLDGRSVEARQGDTLLTAVLSNGTRLRVNEFDGTPRAGFCLMGACQDCWLQVAGRGRLRACTTFVEEGMEVTTGAEPSAGQAR